MGFWALVKSQQKDLFSSQGSYAKGSIGVLGFAFTAQGLSFRGFGVQGLGFRGFGV